MKVILATGIYPPEIGGPATYVYHLAKELSEQGLDVHVIAYGEEAATGHRPPATSWPVTFISRKGGPYIRWKRYAKALKELSADVDIVYCFSSVSVGVPLWMANLKHVHTVLRLGGDFLWERYTDRGGAMSLREYYASGPRFQGMMNGILKQFQYIVFSTHFQEELYEKYYQRLPLHGVIENALPQADIIQHSPHKIVRLLYLGRFVAFKNLESLVIAIKSIPDATLTLVGDGPMKEVLQSCIEEHRLEERVSIQPPAAGMEKQRIFEENDVLVLPSWTEISPNTALEARAHGLPVLLTEETGLSRTLSEAMLLRTLRTSRDIVHAIVDLRESYEMLADRSSNPLAKRGWEKVAQEHVELFRKML